MSSSWYVIITTVTTTKLFIRVLLVFNVVSLLLAIPGSDYLSVEIPGIGITDIRDESVQT